MRNRLFKIWYYTVSHRQMLLRSVGNNDICNMDIYFGDVSYIELPTKLNEIEIMETCQEDIDYIVQRIGKPNGTVTVLMSERRKYFVVSSIVKIVENDLAMFELPFEITNYTGLSMIRNT